MYSEVAATPATELASWVSAQPGFGAAVAGSFETYPDWQAGWILDSMEFQYLGGRQVVVFMAYQTTAPNTRYLQYFNPLTGQMTAWSKVVG